MMCGRVSGKSLRAVQISVLALLLVALPIGGDSFLISADDVGGDQSKPVAKTEKSNLAFQGQCLDENQKPLGNVKIRLFEGLSSSLSRLQAPKPLKLRAETTTNAQGKFSIPFVEFQAGDGMVNPLIIATHKGKFSAVGKMIDSEIPEMADHAEGTPLPAKLTLIMKSPIVIPSQTASLTGTVTDAAGKPVPRAQVTLYAEGVFDPIPGLWTVQTDQNGRYSIEDLTAWKAEPIVHEFAKDGSSSWTITPPRRKLAVVHDDFPMTIRDIEEIPARIDLQLPPTVKLRGIVIDGVNGKPATNAIVKAKAISSPEIFEAATGIDGRYRMTVPKGTYSIWAEAADRVCVVNPVVETDSRQPSRDVDFRLVAGAIVTGQILDEETGQPIVPSNPPLIGVGNYGPASVHVEWLEGEVIYDSSNHVGLNPLGSVNADGTFRLRVAPGKNCVFLTGISRSWNENPYLLDVKDGEGLKIELVVPANASEEMPANDNGGVPPANNDGNIPPTSDDSLLAGDEAPRKPKRRPRPKYVEDPELLAATQLIQVAKYNRRIEKIAAEANGGKTPNVVYARIPSRHRNDTPVNRLLNELEAGQLNRISPPQYRTLRHIVEMGPAAIPDLIEELDATQDPWMISKLGLLLRAIDDRRAVPALIRAIPKAYELSYLDIPEIQFGIRVRESLFCGQLASSDDPQLAEFFQRHSLSKSRTAGEWSFEPMMEEFFGALTHLTGARNGEWHLLRTHDPKAIPRGDRRGRAQAVAQKWTDWWNVHQHDQFEPDVPIAEEAQPFDELQAMGATVYRDGAMRGNPVGTVFNPQQSHVDTVLEITRQFKHLRSLHLVQRDNEQISAESWQQIGQLTSLEELNILGFEIDDHSLEQIGKLKNLFKLSLRAPLNTTAEAWESLLDLKQLSRLELETVDAESLVQIARLENLESLSITGKAIGDEHLRSISRMKGLCTLELQRTSITDEGLAQLANMPNLTYLRLSHCEITGTGLKSLASLPKLIVLNLARTQITGDGFGSLARVKTLEHLSVAGSALNDDGLQEIAKIASLTNLNIGTTWVTDEGLKALESLKKLTSLQVGETPVTRAASHKLKQAIPKLDVDHRPDRRFDE